MNLRALSRLFIILNIVLVFFAAIALLSLLGQIGCASLRRQQVLTRFRSRLVLFEFKLISRATGLKIKVEGESLISGAPFLLLSNHVSYWDIIALCSLFPLGFVAKEEVRGWPFLGRLAGMCQVVFVKRESRRSRSEALYQLAKRSQNLAYCVFPEGTTTAADAPVWDNWHRGNIALAARPGLVIYTVGLHYRDQPDQAWVGDASFFPHFYRALARPRTELFISLGRLSIDKVEPRTMIDLSYRSYLEVCRHCHAAKALAAQTPRLSRLSS